MTNRHTTLGEIEDRLARENLLAGEAPAVASCELDGRWARW